MEQVPHQRAHPSILNQVVEILQSEHGAQGGLINAKLRADLLKIRVYSFLNQSSCPPRQQDHTPRGAFRVNDADLFLRILLKRQLPPRRGSSQRTGKVSGNGKADGAVRRGKRLGKGVRRWACRGGRGLLLTHRLQKLGNANVFVVHKLPLAHQKAQRHGNKTDEAVFPLLVCHVGTAVAHNIPGHKNSFEGSRQTVICPALSHNMIFNTTLHHLS